MAEGANAATQKPSPPDFSNMSNEEQVAWVQEHASELNIDLSKVTEIDTSMVDQYVRGRLSDGTWITCENATCGGALPGGIGGDFNTDTDVITLFKPTFEAGPRSIVTGVSESRENAKLALLLLLSLQG